MRPTHQRLKNRVRALLVLCLLACCVGWQMREAWRELWFADTGQEAKTTRDPVAPAQRSASAKHKAATHALPDGSPAHSWRTPMPDLAALARNSCPAPNAGPDAPSVDITTRANPTRQRALDLIQAIHLQADIPPLILPKRSNQKRNSASAAGNCRPGPPRSRGVVWVPKRSCLKAEVRPDTTACCDAMAGFPAR